MDSDDDTPLGKRFQSIKISNSRQAKKAFRKPKLQTQQKTQLFTRWQSITDKVFAIKVQNTTASELTPANRTLLEENLDYDESKYSANLTNVILVQLIEKPNENENRDENKENEPVSSENKLQEIRENGIQEIEDSEDEKDSESGQEKKTSNAGSVSQIENIPEDESDDDNFVIDMVETVDPETLPEAMKDKSSDSIEITKSRPSSPVGESSISQPKIKGDEDKESQKSMETKKTTQRTEPSSANSNESSGAPKNTDNQENVPVVQEILDSTDPLSAQENEDDLVEVVSDRPPPEIDTFWCLENCKISGLKSVPPSFQSRNNPGSPNVDFSVGGLYYKIYAAIQERRHASNLIIRPTFISHKRLYLAIEQKNYSNTSAFMEAAKEAYLDKMVEEDINMSASTFCRECFRVFSTPFDLQVHKELVHNIQHAATCRICEYNFGQPSILLKHMAAVHSRPHNATQGGREIMGAYKCQLCKFCSPLYSELIRHFKDYHANSGWLLCPFCTRCFSSDVQYENHLQLHINKDKFFRCQSCRLVFESETSRSRHEIEMHGRAKWLQVEANPCVPAGIKVWVRGEADSRSKIVDCEGLKDDQAVRALCLRDCTNHSAKQTFSGGKRKALPKGVEKLIPKHLIVAKKAFREEVLTSQRRSQAAPTKEMTEEESAKQEEDKELKKLIREKEDESGRLMPNRLRNTFEHQMCELVYHLSGAKDEQPVFPIQPQMKELCDIKVEILEKNELEQKLKIEQSVKLSAKRFFDFKTDPMFAVPELKKEKSIFDIERENEELKKKGAEDMAIEDRNMDGKYYECIECKSTFDTGAELVAHFSLCPIRTTKGEWDTSCPVLAADRKSLETNDSAPSLLKFLTPVLEPVWNNEPREDIRRSYPEGVMSSSGKQWHDFTDATSIVRHLQKYPKNSLIITESQEHKDAVYEGKQRKRLKQMIQAYASQNQQVADLDKSMIQGLTDKLTMKKKFIEDEDEIEEHMENMPSDLKKLHGVLTFKKREPELNNKDQPLHREERQIMVAADGPNFETVIEKRQLSSPKIPRKVERALQSIFKKKQLEIKSKQQLESQNKQQQLAPIKPNVTKAVAYKQNTNAYWSTSQQNLQNRTNVTSNLTQGYRAINGTQNLSNINENGVRLEYAQQAPRASQNNYHQYSNNSQIPQRRPANQNTGPRAKTATLCGRLPRNAATLHLPVSPAGCKFPIVTHKSIHVEIIPSEDAKKFANVDQYEIQFKGKKSPNVYKVRPSIKVVKLIGLQSDTLYEIKIYATRHGVRSQPLIKSVLTPKKPKGVIAAGEVIELD